MTSAWPATAFFIPLIAADFFETLLSNANGPNISAFKFSFLARSVNSFASIELWTLSKTSSVAESIDILGLSIPIRCEKLTTFLKYAF